MNTLMLAGRARNFKPFVTGNGTQGLNFTLCERTNSSALVDHQIAVFGPYAEAVQQHAFQGMDLTIRGSLGYRTKDIGGVKVQLCAITAEQVYWGQQTPPDREDVSNSFATIGDIRHG